MRSLDDLKAASAALNRDEPLTRAAVWGFIAIVEAHREEWRAIDELPLDHPLRAGATKRQLRKGIELHARLSASLRALLPYLDR